MSPACSFLAVNVTGGAHGGIGALLHSIMLARHYAQRNELQLALLSDALHLPFVFGFKCNPESMSPEALRLSSWPALFVASPLLPIIHGTEAVSIWPPVLLPNDFDAAPLGDGGVSWKR